MKQNKMELEVDIIGGQDPLTKEEDKAITEYLKSLKQKRERNQIKGKVRGTKSLKAVH